MVMENIQYYYIQKLGIVLCSVHLCQARCQLILTFKN